MEKILDLLREYVARQYLKMNPADLPVDQPLVSTGLIDSFSLVDLALFIEGSFRVRIEDTELNASTFDTLDQLATLIATRQ